MQIFLAIIMAIMCVCINYNDSHDIRVFKVSPEKMLWKDNYTSYHTPEEIGVIAEYDTILSHNRKKMSYKSIAISHGFHLPGFNERAYKDRSVHMKWVAAAHRWRAWKRRQAAIAAWERMREEE